MLSTITNLELDYFRNLNKSDAIGTEDMNPFFKSFECDPVFRKEIEEYANEKLMIQERYLFVKKIGNVVHTKCSYCGNERTLKNVPKNQTFSKCEQCNSKLESRNTKHKNHKNSTYKEFVYFDNSKLSNEIIVGYQFGVYRTIKGEFETEILVGDEIWESAKYFFDQKSKNRVIDRHRNSGEFTKTIYTAGSGNPGFRGYCKESLIKAIGESESFKYLPESLIENCYDMVKLLDLYSKYPQIEKLSKIGLNSLIETKVYSSQTHGTINWGGKTIQKMLRLNKAEIRKYIEIISEKRRCNEIDELFFMQQYKKHKITGDEVDSAKELFNSTNHDTFKRMISADKPSRILKYIETQYKKDKKRKNKIYSGMYRVFGDFDDMLKDMKKLGMEINKSTIYPKNLNKHHVNLSKRVNQVISEKQRLELMKRGDSLEKFCIHSDDYVVIPVKTAEQLVEESNKLNHCVQGYTNKYAKGRCNLFLVRKEEEKDAPFFTLETNKTMELVQCRGKSNKDYKNYPDVDRFVNEFIGNAKKILEDKHERIAN